MHSVLVHETETRHATPSGHDRPPRSGLRMALWSLDPLAELFDPSADAPIYRDGAARVGGRLGRDGTPTTVRLRREQIARGLHDLDADIIVLTGAPRRQDQLQRLFDTAAPGRWLCRGQPDESAIAIALRIDGRRFDPNPLRLIDAGENGGSETGGCGAALAAVGVSGGGPVPLLAEIRPATGQPFRLVAFHIDPACVPEDIGAEDGG